MKPLEILNSPQSDEVLEWNENTGRYQLTLQYVKSLSDAPTYNSDETAKRRSKQTASRVYTYIINHSYTANRQVINFLLNKTENGRKFLKEVLTAQMEADMQYAYNDLVVRPVINAVDGREGDRDVFMRNAVSVETEMLINDSVNYFGFNLCVMMQFPTELFRLVRKYEG